MIRDSPEPTGDSHQAIWAAMATLTAGLHRELRHPLCMVEVHETSPTGTVMVLTLPPAQWTPVA